MKKLSLIGLLLILGVILAVTGCGGATTSINPTSPSTSTTTTTAQFSTSLRRVSYRPHPAL